MDAEPKVIRQRHRIWGIVLLLVGLAIFSLTVWELWNIIREPERSVTAAKEAIERVLREQTVAWNKGDLESFMAGYWRSPRLSFFSGKDPKRGWQDTIQRYRDRYQSEGREMGQVTFSEVDIEMLGTDSAWVRGRWQVVTKKEKLEGLFTLLFKRLPEGWRIVHDHTSTG